MGRRLYRDPEMELQERKTRVARHQSPDAKTRGRGLTAVETILTGDWRLGTQPKAIKPFALSPDGFRSAP